MKWHKNGSEYNKEMRESKRNKKKERYRRLNICIYIYTIEMEQDYNKYIKCRSAHYRMNERHVEEMIEFET